MKLLDMVTCWSDRVDKIPSPVLSASAAKQEKLRQRLDAIHENGNQAAPPAKPVPCGKVRKNKENLGEMKTTKFFPPVNEGYRYDDVRDVFQAFARTAAVF